MDHDFCPVAEAAKLFGDKWTLIVLRDLAAGPRRFKDLERTGEGISPSVLSSRLRELEHQGLITRTSFPEIPPRVIYELTKKGEATLPVIDAIRRYGEAWVVPSAPVAMGHGLEGIASGV